MGLLDQLPRTMDQRELWKLMLKKQQMSYYVNSYNIIILSSTMKPLTSKQTQLDL